MNYYRYDPNTCVITEKSKTALMGDYTCKHPSDFDIVFNNIIVGLVDNSGLLQKYTYKLKPTEKLIQYVKAQDEKILEQEEIIRSQSASINELTLTNNRLSSRMLSTQMALCEQYEANLVATEEINAKTVQIQLALCELFEMIFATMMPEPEIEPPVEDPEVTEPEPVIEDNAPVDEPIAEEPEIEDDIPVEDPEVTEPETESPVEEEISEETEVTEPIDEVDPKSESEEPDNSQQSDNASPDMIL